MKYVHINTTSLFLAKKTKYPKDSKTKERKDSSGDKKPKKQTSLDKFIRKQKEKEPKQKTITTKDCKKSKKSATKPTIQFDSDIFTVDMNSDSEGEQPIKKKSLKNKSSKKSLFSVPEVQNNSKEELSEAKNVTDKKHEERIKSVSINSGMEITDQICNDNQEKKMDTLQKEDKISIKNKTIKKKKETSSKKKKHNCRKQVRC